MFFLLSGEGATDIGAGARDTALCEGEDFQTGPMAIIVDQILEQSWGFRFLKLAVPASSPNHIWSDGHIG